MQRPFAHIPAPPVRAPVLTAQYRAFEGGSASVSHMDVRARTTAPMCVPARVLTRGLPAK
ncbi:hypothetical protein AURDEDRAFT_115809 [Auricularia subglabra TFB-10046 SS5]|nr:hypothetical protein AURDEDRAFT_115809 [Auricularia subglabra TFB-10046 SS5]